jgi:hypothetical protein
MMADTRLQTANGKLPDAEEQKWRPLPEQG